MNNFVAGGLLGLALGGVTASAFLMLGTGPEVGDPVQKPRPVVKTNRYMVVTVKVENGKIYSSFGKFESKEQNGSDIDQKVKNLITLWKGLDETNPQKWDASIAQDAIPSGSGYDFDIDKFGFGSPHKIYFIIANDTIRFDSNKPITFVKYSMQEPDITKREIFKNKSFHNGEPKTNFGLDGRVYYVENRFKKPGFLGIGETDISTKEKLHYSFNLNLWAKSALNPGVEIPMVVDPDTGNGMGWTP
jgi:hypothetical protein